MKQKAREMAESAQRALVRDRDVEYLKQELEAIKKTLDIGRQDQLIEVSLTRPSCFLRCSCAFIDVNMILCQTRNFVELLELFSH